MTATEYQDYLTPTMIENFGDLEVQSEWRAFQGLPYQYCPRVDIAVGPFNVAPSPNRTEEYNQIVRRDNISEFLREIYNLHIENIGDEWLNEVRIPEFERITKRQIESKLLSLGFEIGEISFKPDFAENVVLELSYKGKPLKAGDKVRKTAKIDMVLGDGTQNYNSVE